MRKGFLVQAAKGKKSFSNTGSEAATAGTADADELMEQQGLEDITHEVVGEIVDGDANEEQIVYKQGGGVQKISTTNALRVCFSVSLFQEPPKRFADRQWKLHNGCTCAERSGTWQKSFELLDAAGQKIFEQCEAGLLDDLFSHPVGSLTVEWLAQSGFCVHSVMASRNFQEPFCNCLFCKRNRHVQTLFRAVLRSLAYARVFREMTADEEESFLLRMATLWLRSFCFGTGVVGQHQGMRGLTEGIRSQHVDPKWAPCLSVRAWID